MSNQVAVLKSTALIGADEIQVLRDSLFRGFTDPEVKYCVAICNQLRLSPLLKQIHFVKRKTKVVENGREVYKEVITPQTGIDGFRLAAERAGGYAGSDDAVFEYAPNDAVRKRPTKATVTVYRIVEGVKCSFTASARWEEYYGPSPTQMPGKMPHTMLAKCAEALALRKACPAELSALRTDEEMVAADQPTEPSKAEQLQKRVMGEPPVKPLDKDTIETTARQVDPPVKPLDTPAGDTPAPSCVACGTQLVKSATKPVLYCPKFRDKAEMQHSRVQLRGA